MFEVERLFRDGIYLFSSCPGIPVSQSRPQSAKFPFLWVSLFCYLFLNDVSKGAEGMSVNPAGQPALFSSPLCKRSGEAIFPVSTNQLSSRNRQTNRYTDRKRGGGKAFCFMRYVLHKSRSQIHSTSNILIQVNSEIGLREKIKITF